MPTIIFDLDGVVIDSRRANYEAFAYGLQSVGRPKPAENDVVSLIGLSAKEMLLRLGCPAPAVDRAYHDFVKPHYLENLAQLAQPVPGAVELFDLLRSSGWTVAACTSGDRETQTKALRGIGLWEHFQSMQTPDDSRFVKPQPEFLRELLRKLNAEGQEFWHVEDSSVGLQMGLECGGRCIFADYGFGHPGEHQPHHRISQIGDLRDILGL